ncbi:helix-turn-helix domain-containing protein [Geitlerinema sp. P-1104]|uniref:HNH endonuclease domain-containing protein n=1 Tax=Geitlerinema sp. P-1104 TaxID=2546230 RepID=UPI001476B92C|nr:helix-turn-helix domain-containing protein [Geitlerinema sp. P-1104]
MSKASHALQQALELYGISQNRLARELGVDLPIVFRWFHGQVDPTAETITNIADALRQIEPEAAQTFINAFFARSVTENAVTPQSPRSLPLSHQVNVAALSRLFAETTNSYKFLFFMSLLDILRRRNFETQDPIRFEDLIIEMLANAWYPHAYFRLSLGTQDKIAQKLDALDLEISEPILKFTDTDKTLLREAIAAQDLRDIIRHFRRYVPFRLIIPFLDEELKLKGVSRSRGNELDVAMPAIANQYFESRKPLYCFDSESYKDCQAIIVHPDWADYLELHLAIITGWVSWHWLNYVQRRNPNTPGVVNKLFVPQKRESLEKQTQYWNEVLKVKPIECIYSGQTLTLGSDDLSLDHYLPWSFVAHNQLWNLIPVSQSVNSSKSNNLPAQQYFSKFVDLQYQGICITHDTVKEGRWKNLMESHINDLKLDIDSLLIRERVQKAYELTVSSQIALAVSQGFWGDWIYYYKPDFR